MKYIGQRSSRYPACVPIAICNGLRHRGIATPRPGSKGWAHVIDAADCRDDGTGHRDMHRVAKHLGAKLVRVKCFNLPRCCPILLSILNPEYAGTFLHSVCVVEATHQRARVVNFRTQGRSLVTDHPWGFDQWPEWGWEIRDTNSEGRGYPNWKRLCPVGSVYKIVSLT